MDLCTTVIRSFNFVAYSFSIGTKENSLCIRVLYKYIGGQFCTLHNELYMIRICSHTELINYLVG